MTRLSALTIKATPIWAKRERERLKEIFIKVQDLESIESALLLAENCEAYLKSKQKVNAVKTGAGPHKERKGDKKMGDCRLTS